LADLLDALDVTHRDLGRALGVARFTVDSWTRSEDAHIPAEPAFSALCAWAEARKSGAGVALAAAAGRKWAPPERSEGSPPEAAPAVAPAPAGGPAPPPQVVAAPLADGTYT